MNATVFAIMIKRYIPIVSFPFPRQDVTLWWTCDCAKFIGETDIVDNALSLERTAACWYWYVHAALYIVQSIFLQSKPPVEVPPQSKLIHLFGKCSFRIAFIWQNNLYRCKFGVLRVRDYNFFWEAAIFTGGHGIITCFNKGINYNEPVRT